MRKKVIGIAMGCMLVMLAGCADTTVDWKETESTPTVATEQDADNVLQEEGEDAEVPLGGEPQVTPTKIVERMTEVVPPPSDYFTRQNLTIRGEGEYTYVGTAPVPNAEGTMWSGEIDAVTKTCSYEVSETKNGDGTKTIVATICDYPYEFDNGYRSLSYSVGIVDRQTGIAYTPEEVDGTVDVVFQRTGEDVELSLTTERGKSEQPPFASCTFTVICPEAFDDVVFFLTGNEMSNNPDEKPEGKYRSAIFLRQGESDLMFFH